MVYEVTFEMLTPLAIPTGKPFYPMHFDSLLVKIQSQKMGSFDYSKDAPEVKIPLEQVGDKYKVYKASAMFIDRKHAKIRREAWITSQSWLDYVNGRFATIKAAIPSGTGPYRQKAGYILLLETPKIKFYFSGDLNKVAELLQNLKGGGIGIRNSVGYGKIGKITIAKAKKDYTLVGPDGYPSRVLPAEEIKNPDPRWDIDYTTYRPPYWWNETVKCYVPPKHQYWPTLSPKELLETIKGKSAKE